MGNLNASIGRIVQYTLNETDAAQINGRRTDRSSIQERLLDGVWQPGVQAHLGNSVSAGDVFPMVVVRVWDGERVNGKVFLDGTDEFWVTTIDNDLQPGIPGTWCWPAPL